MARYPHIVEMFTVPQRMHRDGTPSRARVPVLLARDAPARLSIVCFGGVRHRRRDGGCWHVEIILERIRPWYRARTRVRLPDEAKEAA